MCGRMTWLTHCPCSPPRLRLCPGLTVQGPVEANMHPWIFFIYYLINNWRWAEEMAPNGREHICVCSSCGRPEPGMGKGLESQRKGGVSRDELRCGASLDHLEFCKVDRKRRHGRESAASVMPICPSFICSATMQPSFVHPALSSI